MKFITSDTILYCRKWGQTVQFYRDYLNLPVSFETDWFVEFKVTQATQLSIANENRASIKSNDGQGITLSLEVVESAMWCISPLFKEGRLLEKPDFIYPQNSKGSYLVTECAYP